MAGACWASAEAHWRGLGARAGGSALRPHCLPPRPIPVQVPLLATCQLVQRMLLAERRQKEAALARVAALEKQLAGLQGGAAGRPVAASIMLPEL